MIPPDDFLRDITSQLDAAGIPYMIVGSVASSVHGEPRTTNDIDVVIEATAAQLDAFVKAIADRYYVSDVAAREALAERSMFNVIAPELGQKVDLIFLKRRPYDVEEFGRRAPVSEFDSHLPLITPEGSILSKLDWRRESQSQQQLRDVILVAATSWDRLDLAYLRRHAAALALSDELEEVLREAGRLRGTDDAQQSQG